VRTAVYVSIASAPVTETLRPGFIGGLQVARAVDHDPHQNILVYGEVGVGKTRFAGSADEVPSLRPVLVIDVEGGTFTLRSCFPNAEVVKVTSWMDLENIYHELHSGNHPYNTVVVDSLTELQLFNMDQVMTRLNEKDPDRFEKQGDGEVASMLEWQISGKQVRKFVRAMKDLPMTVIFTALMKSDKDKRTGKLVKVPDLPGKLAHQIAGMFDTVLYMYKTENEEGEIVRCALTTSTDTIIAKDRSNNLPTPFITNPSMKLIYEYTVKGAQQ
jgi:hypothetical protein